MQFNLYATFRLLAKTKTITIDLPEGTTIRQAVLALLEQRPMLKPHWLDSAGEMYPHVHILVDGQEVQNLTEKLETPLPSGAVLDFFPPIGGGSTFM